MVVHLSPYSELHPCLGSGPTARDARVGIHFRRPGAARTVYLDSRHSGRRKRVREGERATETERERERETERESQRERERDIERMRGREERRGESYLRG